MTQNDTVYIQIDHSIVRSIETASFVLNDLGQPESLQLASVRWSRMANM